MTEQYNNNKKNYLDLCKNVFDLDEESMKYIDNRLSDNWKPVPEVQKIIDSSKENGIFEDQRITFDIDMSNLEVQKIFEKTDKAYEKFTAYFDRVISYLSNNYNCVIGYKEFIDNKVVFKKNITKIKKVLEFAFAEKPELYYESFNREYEKKECADKIVRIFEEIGSDKKSAKKLKLVISFNPMDWLLSSTAENWSSCFNIDNKTGGYRYCLGLPFLCGDNNRLLLYITDGSEKEDSGIKAQHFLTRTWAILNENGKFCIVKWYPNDTIGVAPVNTITNNNCFAENRNFKKSKYPVDVISTVKGISVGIYSDMGELVEEDEKLWWKGNNKTGQQIYTKNLIRISEGNSTFNIRESTNIPVLSWPGFIIPKWKKLGYHLDLMSNALRCSCGSEKNGFVVNNEYYCQDCYKENLFTCGSCNGTKLVKNEGENIVETADGKKIKLCKECYINRQKFICDCCGKYIADFNSLIRGENDKQLCEDCFNNNKNGYIKCSCCGKITTQGRIIYNTFDKTIYKYCSNCIENFAEKESITYTFGRVHRNIVKSVNKSRLNNE